MGGDLARGQHADGLLGQAHVLNVDAAGLHHVVGELALDVLLASAWTLPRCWVNSTAPHALQL